MKIKLFVVGLVVSLTANSNSVRAQGFTDPFNSISPDWTIIGNPTYFTASPISGANNVLLISASPGGFVGGGVRPIVGAGPGDWSVSLGILPISSLTEPSATGHLEMQVGFGSDSWATLSLATTSGTFGTVAIAPDGSNSAFTPYTFTRGGVFYPFMISASGGTITYSFDGNIVFTSPDIGYGPTSIRLAASGGVAGYVLDNLNVTATAAPEPTTAAIALLGFVSLFAFHKRTRHAKQS